jgi:hypothetical protein
MSEGLSKEERWMLSQVWPLLKTFVSEERRERWGISADRHPLPITMRALAEYEQELAALTPPPGMVAVFVTQEAAKAIEEFRDKWGSRSYVAELENRGWQRAAALFRALLSAPAAAKEQK